MTAMRFRLRRPEELNIDLTPLIDMVFLLLIFFMVTTTFRKEADVQITLPHASAENPSTTEPTVIEIHVDAQGSYFINDQPLAIQSPEVLKATLSALPQRTEQPLLIRADAQARHQAVVTVLDIAGQLGFHRINIATVQTQPASP